MDLDRNAILPSKEELQELTDLISGEEQEVFFQENISDLKLSFVSS